MLVGLRPCCSTLRAAGAWLPRTWNAAGCPHFHGALCTLPAPQQAPAPVEQEGRLTVLPGKRPVKPLSITQEQLVYESSVDMEELVATARRKCNLGAVLAVGGFASFLASIATTVPPALFVLVLGGASANVYVLTAMARRLMVNLAARHVERVVVLPTPPEELPPAAPGLAGGPGSLLLGAATIEERLGATYQLCLEVRTANVDRWLMLVEPRGAAGEGSEYGGGAFGGADRRASFADICGRLQFLHIDPDAGVCPDQSMLSAVMSTPKVVAEERATPRSDVGAPVQFSSDAVLPIFSEMTDADVAQAAKLTGIDSPSEVVEKIGRRAALGGTSVLLAGMLFLVGQNAKDEDGLVRWKNLHLPM